MSSREISELTGKRHTDVMRDIRNMYEQIGERISASAYIDKQGKERRHYLLDQEMTLLLISGYSVPLRRKIISRWQELEQKEQFQIPQTLPEALQLAADLALKIEEDKPKIEVYERLADRKSDVSTTILAKQLGTTAFKLNKFLRDKGIKWQQADLPKAGYSEWMNVVADVKNGHEFTQCLVTPFGQIEIAKLWESK
jgi:anti-repressor protein